VLLKHDTYITEEPFPFPFDRAAVHFAPGLPQSEYAEAKGRERVIVTLVRVTAFRQLSDYVRVAHS
jgi:hypothetical protein